MIDEQGESVTEAVAGGKYRLFCPQTPFYAEAGGQVGDRGEIRWQGGRFAVKNTRAAAAGLVLHEGVLEEGTLAPGTPVELCVTDDRRLATMRNHTATHLLQAAMKEVLGDHVKQAGSLVNEERLRFDFTHFSPLSSAEIRAIEELVNREIRANTAVDTAVLAREEAIAQGATALFGEKYGDEVRVVSIGRFSKELCGGTHVRATGDIGLFKIISEGGIAAGVRRIEAMTGAGALAHVQDMTATAAQVADLLSGPFAEAPQRIEALFARQKELEKELAGLAASRAMSDLDSLLAAAEDVSGIQVIAGKIPLDSAKTLREVGDRVRDRMGSGVAVLGGEINGKAALLALVSKDLTGRIKAGPLVAEVAAIVGGKGGGRPDMAQAGGPMVDKLDEAVAAVPGIVANLSGEEK
jgi:alanyl-tRNA synthetase